MGGARWLVPLFVGVWVGAAVSGCATPARSAAGPPPATTEVAPSTPAPSPGVPDRCRTVDLSAALGPRQARQVNVQGELGAAGTHYTIPLNWTNTSDHACTLTGFGGVDIVGPDTRSTPGGVYSLPRAGGPPRTVTLTPGAGAHTRISYIADDSGNPHPGPFWTPDHLRVTPPDETTAITVPWAGAGPVYWGVQDSVAAGSISPVTGPG